MSGVFVLQLIKTLTRKLWGGGNRIWQQCIQGNQACLGKLGIAKDKVCVKVNFVCTMNVLTRRMARTKACLCCKPSFPRCSIILPLIILLGLIFWINSPGGEMLKRRLGSLIQRQIPEVNLDKEDWESLEETTREPPWLVEPTQARLWIGKGRLIGLKSAKSDPTKLQSIIWQFRSPAFIMPAVQNQRVPLKLPLQWASLRCPKCSNTLAILLPR